MSNDISYVVRVQDDFTATLRRFQAEVAKSNLSTGNFSSHLKSVKANSQLAATQGVDKYAASLNNANIATANAAHSSKFFTQNLKDLGKAAGIYFGFQQVKDFAVGIYDTRVQMDGLEASLSAILPMFDNTKSGTQLATEEINYLREATNRLGAEFKQILPAYTQFLSNAGKLKLGEAHSLFESLIGYGGLNSLSSEQQKQMLYAVQQMLGRGKIQGQEFNLQLKPVMPRAADIFERALKRLTKGTADANKSFDKLMEEGRVGAAGVLKEVDKIIKEDFGESINKKSHTLGKEVNRSKNAFQEFSTILSTKVGPNMKEFSIWSQVMMTGLNDVFKAINDNDAFSKLNTDLQFAAKLLGVIGGFLHGVVEEIKWLAGGIGFLFKLPGNVGKAIGIAGAALTGTDKEIVKGAYQELFGQTPSFDKYVSPPSPIGSPTNPSPQMTPIPTQEVEVKVIFENAPPGIRTEISRPSSKGNLGVSTEAHP